MVFVNNQTSAASASQFSLAHASSSASSARSDFRAVLTQLYEEPANLLREYADPTTAEMEINGFGVLDKNNTATSLAIGVLISRFDSQLTTLLNGFEFTLKTLPSKADSLWG